MTAGNFWETHGLEEKIVGLLAEVSYYEPNHHFGRPFLTAYQLAILFKERYPEEFRRFGHPVAEGVPVFNFRCRVTWPDSFRGKSRTAN